MSLLKSRGKKVKIFVKIPNKKNGHKAVIFVAGGRRRVSIGDGFSLVNARVRFSNGEVGFGVLEIDEQNECKRTQIGVFLPNGSLVFSVDDLSKALNIPKSEIVPISSEITAAVPVQDAFSEKVEGD